MFQARARLTIVEFFPIPLPLPPHGAPSDGSGASAGHGSSGRAETLARHQRRHAAGAGLPSCGSLAKARRRPGRISESRAGIDYPKGENNPGSAGGEQKRQPWSGTLRLRRSFLLPRPKTAPRRSGPPISRAGNGGGAHSRAPPTLPIHGKDQSPVTPFATRYSPLAEQRRSIRRSDWRRRRAGQ